MNGCKTAETGRSKGCGTCEEREDRFREAPLSVKLKVIVERIGAYHNRDLKAMDLTSAQMHVLVYLAMHADHPVTQKELRESMGVKHPTMVGIIERLGDKGFVSTHPGEENRRFQVVELTEKSRVLLQNNYHAHKDREIRMLQGITEKELSQFSEILVKIHQNLLKEEVSENT